MFQYGQASAPAAKRYGVWRQDRCNSIRKRISGANGTDQRCGSSKFLGAQWARMKCIELPLPDAPPDQHLTTVLVGAGRTEQQLFQRPEWPHHRGIQVMRITRRINAAARTTSRLF